MGRLARTVIGAALLAAALGACASRPKTIADLTPKDTDPAFECGTARVAYENMSDTTPLGRATFAEGMKTVRHEAARSPDKQLSQAADKDAATLLAAYSAHCSLIGHPFYGGPPATRSGLPTGAGENPPDPAEEAASNEDPGDANTVP